MALIEGILPGLVLNVLAGFVVIVFIYYPAARSQAVYVFTFFTFNILIFFIAGLLRDVQLTLGMGFGLLVVFSVLRFQTERMPVREMTFLFISISIPFVNQLFMSTRITVPELAAINLFIVVCVYLLDRSFGVRAQDESEIVNEKIENIRLENRANLLAELRQRTGLPITRLVVDEIDLKRDVAQIRVFYEPGD